MHMPNTWLVVTAFAITALLVPTHAIAHESHSKKKPAAVKKEQKEWGIAGDAKDVKRTIKQIGRAHV